MLEVLTALKREESSVDEMPTVRADQGVGQKLDAVDVDRRVGGDARIRADGAQIAPVAGLVEHHRQHGRQHQHHKDGHRQKTDRVHAEVAKEVAVRPHLAGIADEEAERTEDRHRAQRHDERGDLAAGDHEAVERTGEAAQQQGDGNADRHRQVLVADDRQEVVQRQDADRADKGRHRPDREIDAAADDDKGHPQGDDPGVRDLAQDIEDVLHLEKIGTEDRGDDEQHDQCDQGSVFFVVELF
jgi:hypothetical protein